MSLANDYIVNWLHSISSIERNGTRTQTKKMPLVSCVNNNHTIDSVQIGFMSLLLPSSLLYRTCRPRFIGDSFFYGPHCSHLSFLIKIISPVLTIQSQYVANRSSRLYLLQCSLPPYHTTTITIGQYIDLIYNVRNMYANYV